MNHLQVTLKGDEHQVDDRAVDSPPEKVLTEKHQAQSVARRPGQLDLGQLGYVRDYQQEAAVKIEHVLVERTKERSKRFNENNARQDGPQDHLHLPLKTRTVCDTQIRMGISLKYGYKIKQARQTSRRRLTRDRVRFG